MTGYYSICPVRRLGQSNMAVSASSKWCSRVREVLTCVWAVLSGQTPPLSTHRCYSISYQSYDWILVPFPLRGEQNQDLENKGFVPDTSQQQNQDVNLC